MGWKSFKEHFNIGHVVHITEKGLCIASPYVNDLVTINLSTGELVENKTFSGFCRNHYPKLSEATREEIIKVLNDTDYFEKLVPVYSVNDSGNVIEDFAETLKWPSVTVNGTLMYDNVFYPTKKEAIIRAKENLKSSIRFYLDGVESTENELERLKSELRKSKDQLDKLSSQTETESLIKS